MQFILTKYLNASFKKHKTLFSLVTKKLASQFDIQLKEVDFYTREKGSKMIDSFSKS